MKRREAIVLAGLGLIGCATGGTKKAEVAPSPAPTPIPTCVVCGAPLDPEHGGMWWVGPLGPFCKKHSDEEIAKDRPKKGLVSQNLVFHYGEWPRRTRGPYSA